MPMLNLTLRRGAYAQIGPNIRVYNNENHPIDITIDAPRDLRVEREQTNYVNQKKKERQARS